MKKKKRTPLSIALSLVIAIIVASSVYLFSQTQTFRDIYVSLLSRDVLPVDKWEYEGLMLASEKYELENPDIVKTEDGYKMYFHGKGNIYVALSSDGLNWEIVEKPIFTGAGGVAVVQLPDKRFRMYFQPSELGGAFKSAISEDGINFEIEEGIRFIEGKDSFEYVRSIGHPNIIEEEDGYKLYFDTGPYGAWLEAKAINDKCEILYKEGAPEIHYAYSKDGLNWTYGGKVIKFKQVPIPYFIGGWSPGIIKIENEYRMYFHATRIKLITTNVGDVTNCKIKPILDPLWLAISKDGINFDIAKQLTTFKSDPEVVKVDNKLRLYVWGKNNIYSYVQNFGE